MLNAMRDEVRVQGVLLRRAQECDMGEKKKMRSKNVHQITYAAKSTVELPVAIPNVPRVVPHLQTEPLAHDSSAMVVERVADTPGSYTDSVSFHRHLLAPVHVSEAAPRTKNHTRD